MRLLIKNGTLIDAKKSINEKLDVIIESGIVAKIAKNIAFKDAHIIDAKGLLVMPGFVDMHAHLREPGYEDKETIETGSRAAARGGFTTVCCMPNTNPVIDNQGVAEFIISQARKNSLINIFPIGSITRGLEGKELSDIADLKATGAVAISDDGNPVMNSEIMRRAMEYASMFDLPVISHSEDKYLSAEGCMNEGYISTVLGLKGMPRIAEISMIARDIELARYTQVRLHIAHVSCKESVDLLRRAKKEGICVTCECCPHHFSLTDEAVSNYDTNTKVNPPLRTKEDVEALKKGLKDGTIDCIATDHAPHTEAEKEAEFDSAPFGIIGLETAASLAFTELISKGVLTPLKLVEKMSWNPSSILNLNRGFIGEGCVADIVLFDPGKKWVVNADEFLSKSKNSPFIGTELKGQTVMTICAGKIVFKT